MKDKALYRSDAAGITPEDIEKALRDTGLRKGDTVMVHSDVGVFGKLGDVRSKENFLDAILNTFLNIMGKEGTLIVPTFTYSFCKKEVFDVRNSPSTVGLFTEHVRKKKESIRSVEPIFSCSGIGSDAKKLLGNVGSECFGKDSIFDKLYRINAKLMLFGRPFDITYTHYVENVFKVSYRFDKVFSGTIIDENGNRYSHEVTYYVRCLDKNVKYNMEHIGNELFKRGLLKRVGLGSNQVLLCRAKDVFDVGMEMLKEDEYSFLEDIPERTGDVKVN